MEPVLSHWIYITGIIPTFVARNEVTPLELARGCMVYTERAPRRQQFGVAPAMYCVKQQPLIHSRIQTTGAKWVCAKTENSAMELQL